MKKAIVIIAALFIVFPGFGQQSGVIKYVETMKLDIKGPEGMDLGDMVPSEISNNQELYFDGNISVYQEAKDNVHGDLEMESDDGAIKMVIKTSDNDEIMYTNIKDKLSIHQTAFMGKEFLIEEKLEKPKWKITSDRIKYLGYVCQKATKTEVVPPRPGSTEGALPEERNIVAWFTSELPVAIGPDSYNQLPGAILMVSVNEGKTEIKATEVLLKTPDADILQKPTKGQRVTNEEYEKIVAEKMKEMKQMNGGRGERIIIRG